MIGLDTNVLLRYFVQDDPVQSPRAIEIIERVLPRHSPGFISVVTLAELAWVLDRRYKRTRLEIAAVVELMLAQPHFQIQSRWEVFQAMQILIDGKGDFADALIGALGFRMGCAATLTFDEEAAELPYFQAAIEM